MTPESEQCIKLTYVLMTFVLHSAITLHRSEYRGLMLDLARHFHDKDTVKSVLDLMWRYKLNTLHLHLTDDESWSLEIDGLPELTEVGISNNTLLELSELTTSLFIQRIFVFSLVLISVSMRRCVLTSPSSAEQRSLSSSSTCGRMTTSIS